MLHAFKVTTYQSAFEIIVQLDVLGETKIVELSRTVFSFVSTDSNVYAKCPKKCTNKIELFRMLCHHNLSRV